MIPRHLLCLLVAPLLLAADGCLQFDRITTLGGREVEMKLTSNVEDTTFRYRVQKVDAASEDGWVTVGTGTSVTAMLNSSDRYELEAAPLGYEPKRVKLTETLPRYEFALPCAAANRSPVTSASSALPTANRCAPPAGGHGWRLCCR